MEITNVKMMIFIPEEMKSNIGSSWNAALAAIAMPMIGTSIRLSLAAGTNTAINIPYSAILMAFNSGCGSTGYPSWNGHAHDTVHIPGLQHSLLGNAETENFVSNTKSHAQPVPHRKLMIDLLGQGTGHETVPKVDHRLGDCHLHERRP